MLSTHLSLQSFIKQKLSKIKLWFEYLFFKIRVTFASEPQGKKKIFFVLESDRLYRFADGEGRYALHLANLFSESGYAIFFHKKINFRVYSAMGLCGRMIDRVKNLKVVERAPKDPSDLIFAFDDEKIDAKFLEQPWKRRVYINILKSPAWKFEPCLWIPYFMHRVVYQNGAHLKLNWYRKNERKIRIFFGGNTSPVYYRSTALKDLYGQLTRLDALDALFESNAFEKVRIKHVNVLLDLLSKEKSKYPCVIFETQHAKYNTRRWPEIMSSAEFFLCLSGTDVPMCHNAIEAMAVGTIPIISYPDWFFPPLEHGKNALIYHGKEGLIRAAEAALRMSEAEIARMRANVIEYFDTNLSFQNFIKKFESSETKLSTLMLHPRYVCTEADKKECPDADFNALVSKVEKLN